MVWFLQLMSSYKAEKHEVKVETAREIIADMNDKLELRENVLLNGRTRVKFTDIRDALHSGAQSLETMIDIRNDLNALNKVQKLSDATSSAPSKKK